MTHQTIKIGKIDYTNTWPITFYFPQFVHDLDIEWMARTPTEINRAIAQRDIDIATISSFAYGQLFEDVMLIPQLSVSAYGQVSSVLLFHEKPLHEIKNGHIALPPTSATSVHLLKIILEKFYRGKPKYTSIPGSLGHMMADQDGALLIGDDAIREKLNNKKYHITDLATEWTRWTGMWISFAVWVIRRSFATHFPAIAEQIVQAYYQAKRMATSRPMPLIHEAQSTIGGTVQFWEHYFQQLCYDLGTVQRNGLQLFFQYAYELGFLPKQVNMHIRDTYSVDRVSK